MVELLCRLWVVAHKRILISSAYSDDFQDFLLRQFPQTHAAELLKQNC